MTNAVAAMASQGLDLGREGPVCSPSRLSSQDKEPENEQERSSEDLSDLSHIYTLIAYRS